MTEPTYNQQQASLEDPSVPVQVAKISRTTAILVAVITAVGAGVAAALPAYFTGRNQGEQAATPGTVTETVTNTATKTVSAAAGDSDHGSSDSSSTAPPGEVHLADRTPVEGEDGVTVGKATVRNKEYSRTVATMGCIEKEEFAYNIDSGIRSFHTSVGLSDDSRSATINFAVLVDGQPRGGGASITVGEIAEMNVDVSGGFRLTVQVEAAEYTQCDVTAVLIDPVLRP